MDVPEYKKIVLEILNAMCNKFDLEKVWNVEKMTGEGSDREFSINLSIWKLGFLV